METGAEFKANYTLVGVKPFLISLKSWLIYYAQYLFEKYQWEKIILYVTVMPFLHINCLCEGIADPCIMAKGPYMLT
jgi:hypothetical protein